MIIAYSDKVQPGFAACTEVDNGNGTISLQKPNGKFLAVTPEGSVEERDTPGGVWESFKKGSNCIIAERDGEAKGPLVYVLMGWTSNEHRVPSHRGAEGWCQAAHQRAHRGTDPGRRTQVRQR